ncbi:MAG: ATP-binding cassette domain-containing protein [Myxococcota bacterium]
MTLRVEGLGVEFDGASVLEDVSFESRPGQITAIIGPPASGKTVLLKAVAGLVRPACGIISHNRMTVSGSREWQRRIGMAFQNDALFDAMTVAENVAFPLRRAGASDADDRARAMLERVGLAHAAGKLPSEISGGMRRRCGIARAAIVDPAIGLFDDPSAGLDPETSDQIFELIRTQAADNVCLVVSNALPSVLAVANQVLMLHRGRVEFVGTPEEIGRAEHPVVHQFVRGAVEGPL